MSEELHMFKLYDIRTKRENLTDEVIFRLITALAKYYRESVQVDSVYVGRDARLYCAELMDKVLEIFPAFGLNVFFNPVQISTCQFYYSCMVHRNSGGLMITASHNPKEYVGFKLVGKDVSPIAMGCGPDGGIEKVRSIFSEGAAIPDCIQRGKVHVAQYQKEYVEYSLRLAGIQRGDLSGLKIFGEFLSGTAGTDFALAMDIAGADVTLSHAIPDGLFLQGDPNPIIEKSIAPARKAVEAGDYDLGFCFDGDGDRMDLMYPDGSQIIPGLNMSLLIPYIKRIFIPYYGEKFNYKAFVDVKAVPLALTEISKAGIEQHIIRNGHSFIKENLREHREEGFIVSEEESAHYYMNFPYDPDDLSKGFAATENTLFFALLSAKVLKENREGYKRIFNLQKGINRRREWPLCFNVYEEMENVMTDVENLLRSCGATVIKNMDDGAELDATLMRFHLPARITADTEFPDRWCQVAQRISRSEDAMTRWEVVASDQNLCRDINALILSITDDYVRRGVAHY